MKAGQKPKNTWFDWLLTVLGLGALAAVSLYAALCWEWLPAELPTHVNAAGEMDAFGEKASLLGLLAIAWALYGIISLIEAIPAVWNTGTKTTPENSRAVYRTVKTMLSVLKLTLALFFAYVILCAALCRPLTPFAMPVYLLAIFGTLLWCGIRIFKKR